jgi:hypothetical protein
MDIAVTKTVTDQMISDLLCDGMEGGCAYWATVTDLDRPEGCEYYHQSPLMGGSFTVQDTEDEGLTGTINIKSIHKGLQVMADKYPWHFKNVVSDNPDACPDGETADVFIQCCAFGEIIFG